MNATAFLNAVKSAIKPAAIGFATILALAISTILATEISTLLTLLIPLFATATKAAIYGYPLFIAGLLALKIQGQYQKKEAPTIAILPPSKPCEKQIKQIETIQNEVFVTSLSTEIIFSYHLSSKPPTWQQQILKEIQPTTEIQDASQPTEALAIPGTDTALRRDAKPLNNQLAISTICWQAIARTAKLLDAIKASEMKEIAAEFDIPKYRKMNKSQLLIEIISAHNSAPEFSQ